MAQEVENEVEANLPDIILLRKNNKKLLFINVTVLMDINMTKAAADKYKKYRDLEIATKKQLDLKKAHTIPIVVGAL
eukprot:3681564-Ditylum_brightwellii.AAC.1